MKRRTFLEGVVAGSMLHTLAGQHTAAATEPTANRRPPNILIIHTDQHRYDCLGVCGNTQVATPNIDALAADGVRFTNSFCPYPVCTPSRYSLLTGLPVHDHTGYSNHCTLPPGTDTFPALLKAAGYHTKAVGKMHFTPTYFDVGFEDMLLSEQDGPGRWDDDYHRYLRDRGLVDRNDLEDQRSEYRKQAPPEYWRTFGALESNLPEEHHSTTWIGDRAVETLEAWPADRPNLLMTGFIKPHHPFDPPPGRWTRHYDPSAMHILPGWTDACLERDLARSKGYFPHRDLSPDTLRRIMAFYYACISQIDHHVGRLIDVLKRRGLYDRTLIVFTSDHGEYLGYHHMLLKGNHLYEPLARVPLIVKYPDNADAGTVRHDLVSNVDLAPTLLRAAGLPPGPHMHGHDLAAGPTNRKTVFAEDASGATVMARSHTRKLILMQNDSLLFDLEKDPLELENVYDDPAYADDRRSLTTAIDAWQPNRDRRKAYLDETAPRISRPNVPALNDHHRDAIIAYYRDAIGKN